MRQCGMVKMRGNACGCMYVWGGSGLVVSMRGIPTRRPEFEPQHGLATFLWKKRSGQRSPTCCRNTILDGAAKLYI